MEKAVDFCFRKGKAVGETKPTERGDCTFGGFLIYLEQKIAHTMNVYAIWASLLLTSEWRSQIVTSNFLTPWS